MRSTSTAFFLAPLMNLCLSSSLAGGRCDGPMRDQRILGFGIKSNYDPPPNEGLGITNDVLLTNEIIVNIWFTAEPRFCSTRIAYIYTMQTERRQKGIQR